MSVNIRREAILAICSQRQQSPPLTPKTFDIPMIFGKHVFNEKVQKQRLPPTVFRSLQETIKYGRPIDPSISEAVASVMRDWAIEQGVMHYSHWFQPMTGSTAEKHDCFVTPLEGGESLARFSGGELVRGEPDASSLPSGGLRATFEARGYTTWDPTSPAFILSHPGGATLVIPTLFVSWTGEALDKKTPLLRSTKAVGKQAIRILRLFGNKTAQRVESTMGAEQEYFLVDRRLAALRPDIMITGRTLFGAKPPKSQELEDNYFGAIPPRVLAFMTELEHELLLLGVPVKTRHNETAPGQFELAPVYENANLATDHQMLVMQLLKSVAARHDFLCLLHEKPFAGVNGSGKHNNWSLVTDEGENLFEPGATPSENAQFLIFCCAVIRAVRLYGDFLRMSVCGASNDQRLGGFEAPPTIMSVCLGGILDEIFNNLSSGEFTVPQTVGPLDFGLPELPPFVRDSGDRNRTSPFAFTGNKFEFRAVGAGQNPAGSTTVLNAIVAESLSYFADRLEEAIAQGIDFNLAVKALIVEMVQKHKEVLFSGDCYSPAWAREAKRRGLSMLSTTADCIKHINSPASVKLFSKMKVYSEPELCSRFEIIAENYIHVIEIETLTALEIASTMIVQAALRYKKDLLATATTTAQKGLLEKLDLFIDDLIEQTKLLQECYDKRPTKGTQKQADYCRDKMIPQTARLRESVDRLEGVVDNQYWPLPSYSELLFIR